MWKWRKSTYVQYDLLIRKSCVTLYCLFYLIYPFLQVNSWCIVSFTLWRMLKQEIIKHKIGENGQPLTFFILEFIFSLIGEKYTLNIILYSSVGLDFLRTGDLIGSFIWKRRYWFRLNFRRFFFKYNYKM